jgi:hypothetical protein
MMSKPQLMAFNKFVVDQRHRIEQTNEKIADLTNSLLIMDNELVKIGKYISDLLLPTQRIDDGQNSKM